MEFGGTKIFMLQAKDPLGITHTKFHQNPWSFAEMAWQQSQFSAFSGGYVRGFYYFLRKMILIYKMKNQDFDSA